ncbi:hypothetical protein L6452_32613 [Arctium lappa]|uniref:Uncharacterized protein n=1 Tax=Arctium lappa TaxID=4217 RepID=A0ACB8Z670_ARCLA|nr:hypothetical protein L6452_32613 [Arctium lappa]
MNQPSPVRLPSPNRIPSPLQNDQPRNDDQPDPEAEPKLHFPSNPVEAQASPSNEPEVPLVPTEAQLRQMRNVLRASFLEEEMQKVFVHKLRMMDIYKVFGVINQPREYRIEYARYMSYRRKTEKYVKNKYGIVTVKEVRLRKFQRIWNMTIRPGNIIFALEAVKRFMRRQINYTYCYDFQLGIETNQKKVNMIKPNLDLVDIDRYDLFTILEVPELGVVYKNGENKKRFFRVPEIAKFSNGILKVIRLQLNQRYKENEEKLKRGEKSMSKFYRLALVRVLDALEDKIHFRRGIRNFESLLGIRQGRFTRWSG